MGKERLQMKNNFSNKVDELILNISIINNQEIIRHKNYFHYKFFLKNIMDTKNEIFNCLTI